MAFTAATAATIGGISAAVGLATTGVSTAMSFTQAAKQQKLYRQANAKAEQAMQEARKKLEVNYMDQLSIMKEPYELQREAMLVQGAQSLEAELMGLEKLSADEESRLRDINVQLDIGEIQGAQMAAADAQQARSAAMTQGFQGLTQMAGYAAEMVPLYMQSAAGKQLGKQEAAYNAAAAAGTLDPRFKGKNYKQAMSIIYNQDIDKMGQAEYTDWMGKQSKAFIKQNNPLTYKFPMQQQQMQSQFTLDPFGFNQQPGIGVMTPEYYNEEAVKYAFDLFVRDGYKGDISKFQKLLATNQEALDYSFTLFERDGYKGGKNKYKVLMGLGEVAAPVATTEPAKTEVATTTTTEPTKTEPITTAATTTPAKTEPAKTEPAKTEPAKELSNKQSEAIKVRSIPQREVEMPVADTNKMPKMVIKSEAKVEPKPVEEVKVEETKVEQPKVEVKPTEEAKVEVKEMKTEQPKMKVKGKLKTEPIKIETIKVESEKGPTTVEVPSFSVPEPRKKYKPYGEEGPDIYYSEENDQYIIKEGDNRTVAEKGSEKYNDIEKRLNTITLNTMFGQGKCPDRVGGCAKNIDQVREYFYAKKQKDGESGLYDRKIIDQEGNLADNIDGYYYAMVEGEDGKPRVERLKQDSLAERYESENHEELNMKDYYIAEEPPKSERFSIYKPFGDKSISLIYDNNTGVIMKETDDKIMSKDGKPMTTWKDVPMYKSEYKELKSIIEGIDYKKAKGSKNTFIPTFNPVPETPEWQKQ